jgi:hypothetical protein
VFGLELDWKPGLNLSLINCVVLLSTLGLKEKLTLEEKVILEDGPSGLLKFVLTQNSLWNIQYSLWNIQYSLWNIQYRLWNIQYSLWNIQYSLWNIPVDMDCFSETTGQIIAKL